MVAQSNLCQYCTLTKREHYRHAVRAAGEGLFHIVSRDTLSSFRVFYLPLNVMDLGQLFIRFMAIDDA